MAARRTLRAGMVGGGPGGFIGDVHRHAMALDRMYDIVAGVFSRDADKSKAFGSSLGIDSARLYTSAEQMAEEESKLPADTRVEVVVVVTPTPSHAATAEAFVKRSFAVVCDKPLCSTVAEAASLIACIKESKSPFMLIHNYSGYPMVKQARWMVASGAIGPVKKVVVEYEQGWLCAAKQLSSTGAISTLADVGTHALQLMEYITGSNVTEVCADADTMVGGARSPDDVNVLFRAGTVRGVLIASQASAGQGNGLRIRVYGASGGLTWEQETPEKLTHLPADAPAATYVRGGPGLCDAAKEASRIPGGHPEGFLEAFANLYRSFYSNVTGGGSTDFPTPEDGLRGLRFIDACMASSESRSWVSIP
eukprot:TRINITY_DN7349_c0_g1_i1.p1 TRINITY_DN7349_c0_g1~~TRINITY_DN7349_c0_g1_i1.p1  ORF type:complete len:365 (+),score=89.05 TRINITY_DN7349_c0_g1_i1:65-1159(+)